MSRPTTLLMTIDMTVWQVSMISIVKIDCIFSWRLFLHGQTPLILAINCIVITIYCVLHSSGGGNGYLFLNIGSLFHFAKGIGNMIVCVTINRKVNLKKTNNIQEETSETKLSFSDSQLFGELS